MASLDDTPVEQLFTDEQTTAFMREALLVLLNVGAPAELAPILLEKIINMKSNLVQRQSSIAIPEHRPLRVN